MNNNKAQKGAVGLFAPHHTDAQVRSADIGPRTDVPGENFADLVSGQIVNVNRRVCEKHSRNAQRKANRRTQDSRIKKERKELFGRWKSPNDGQAKPQKRDKPLRALQRQQLIVPECTLELHERTASTVP